MDVEYLFPPMSKRFAIVALVEETFVEETELATKVPTCRLPELVALKNVRPVEETVVARSVPI